MWNLVDRRTGEPLPPTTPPADAPPFKCVKCHCGHLVAGACRHCGQRPLNTRFKPQFGPRLRRAMAELFGG